MQNGPNQIVLRLALIGGIRGREAIEQQPERGFEGVEHYIVERQPIGRLDDGFGEKIAREQVALECLSDTHLRTASGRTSLQAEPGVDANGSGAKTTCGHIPEAMARSEPVLSSPDRDPDTTFLGPAQRTVPEYDAWMSPLSRK